MGEHRTIAYSYCKDEMASLSKGEITRRVSSGLPPLLNFQTAPVISPFWKLTAFQSPRVKQFVLHPVYFSNSKKDAFVLVECEED